MGLPVIVTNIPGPTDAMKKNKTGLVVKKGDASELYDAMEKLYFSEELRSEMGKFAFDFVSKGFDQKILFEKIKNNRIELIKGSITI